MREQILRKDGMRQAIANKLFVNLTALSFAVKTMDIFGGSKMNVNAVKSTKRSWQGFVILAGVLALLVFSISSKPVYAANYPLEITQPQSNLDTTNRFYKAYPGLDYNVRLAVIGGAYPFKYALTTAPSGMTIDANMGVINWPNPPASTTPYKVTATVTDSESTTQSVSWTITVTTQGFLFIDAVNGHPSVANGGTGTGTIDNPFKSIKDWYEGTDSASMAKNSYAGDFLYYRNGTYPVDCYMDTANNNRVMITDGVKPVVWLAYPGESPVIDFNNTYFLMYKNSYMYYEGLDFSLNGNIRGVGFTITGNSSNVVFRNNKFHGITQTQSGGNNAEIFFSRGTPAGLYNTIQSNEFYDSLGYGVLDYDTRKTLVEDNTFHGTAEGISPKSGSQQYFIRHNTFYNNTNASINVQYYSNQDYYTGDIEISYNLIKSGGGPMYMNYQQDKYGLPVHIYRNTIIANTQQNQVQSTNGPWYWTDNVIINDNSTYKDRIKTYYNFVYPTNFIASGNISGSASDGIVDAQGYLTSGYSQYLGKAGFEIGLRPSAPTGLNVAAQ